MSGANSDMSRSMSFILIASDRRSKSALNSDSIEAMASRGRAVGVVVVPPLVRRRLRVALWRVFPLLLAAEGSDVEVRPRAPHRLIAAAVDEVGAEHVRALTDERIRTVPLVHAEVGVEVVGERVPRDPLPAHSLLQA